MGLTTDFNESPYFDDFDETKNFYRTLFKPGVAVQARELTQLQTVLQNQIERFGNNILVDGTIIQGCNFTEIKNLAYVKILDLNTNGQPVSMSSYDGLKIVGATTGVKGVIQTYATGLDSQDPDLNTLFFKYTDSGNPNNEIKTFNSTENLLLLNSSNTIIDTVTAAGSILTIPADAVGKAYGVKTGDGIIYQKGFFSRVEEQLTVVSKYSNSPNNVVVGFSTDESIINSNIDTSLLDNANGFNNYNAPGADRLKLTPILVTKTTDEAIANSSFFAIQEYAYGRVIRRNNDTQYSSILNVIENRTKEESGNYIVNNFAINTSDSANTSAITLDVNRGLAYVEGKRVELLNKIGIDFPKSADYLTEDSQNISTNYGNYVLVNQFMGRFDTHLGANVALYDTVQTNVTDNAIAGSPAGTLLGTAKIMAITYDSGNVGSNTTNDTSIYKAYISDITMASTKNWNDVRSFVYSTNVGTADLIANSTTIYDQSFKRRVFNTGRSAIKALPAATTSAFYTFRTVNNSLTMANNGVISFTLPSGEWPYSANNTNLNTDQKKDLILVSGATSAPYVANKRMDLSNATVTVTNTTNISITGLSSTSVAIANCILYYNGKKDGITAPTQKILETVYVKIACNTATTNTVGPWSLGFPDVYSIDNVYVGNTSIGYQDSANTAADKTSKFVLNTNQKEDYYGLATISKKSGLSLNSESNLVVKLTRFKKGATDNGFFTVSSYPIDDANTANTAAIQTYEIPTFKSNDIVYDLRDVVDFRPYAVNTAANSITSGSATVNPSAAISFSTGGLVPTPNKELVADYEYYLARKDLLMIDAAGTIVLKSGTPDETPIPPADPSSGMVLADISIPPFPSLTAKLANSVKRKDYGVSISRRNNRSYTMRDIGQIDSRVSSLEYYTALNLLETQTKDLIITGSDGLNRFKNGIFVENFDTLLYADLEDPEYKAGYNLETKEISPIFREYPLSIKPDGTTTNANVDIGNTTVRLSKKNDNRLINQPYATKFRRLAELFWSFTGQARIYPAEDGGWDSTITPAPRFDNDSTAIYTYSSNGNAIRSSGKNRTGITIRERDFENAFMRPQNIRIVATGLRPNARHWFKFDGRSVNAFCAPGAFLPGSTRVAEIYSTEPDGTAVTSDAGGNLIAVFTIPQNTFLVGTRNLEILDISPTIANQDPDFYTSYTNISYTGSNPQRPSRRRDNDDDDEVSLTREERDALGYDPLAQTFRIDKDAGKDNVIMLSKLELYFRQKPTDSSIGVTIEIRETDNGYPSATKIIKNSKVYLKNSEVSTSTTGTVKTIVTFDEPVVLKTNTEYAFVTIPDNNHPDYAFFLSKVGENDLATNLAITQDTFDGTLFTSTNGRAWTPYQDENAKFKLFNAEYDKNGYQHFTNTDHEFFTVEPSSGSFKESELVAKVSANLTQTVTTVKSNTEIAYSGSTLVGTISTGDWIGYWANTTIIDVLKVVSANTSKIVVDRRPKYANNSTKIFKTVVGEVSYQNASNTILHLTDSSASAEYAFVNGDTIRGSKSQAIATITTVDLLKVSLMEANIVEKNHMFTDTKYEVSVIRGSNGTTNIATNQPLSLDYDNLFNKVEATIPSRSLLPSSRSFRIKASLSNNQTNAPYDSTPIINFGGSTINVFEYLINNDSTDETKPIGGNALSRYITLPTTLAENLDADDLNVYLTAYRPAGTTIEVYGRFKNKSDPRQFDQIEWTELALKDSSNLRSSSANVFDYRELEYVMPSVANNAALTNGGGAALNIANSNNLTYKDPDGALYTGYKQYAIKIVFLAESYARIPKVKNIRAIALT